MPDLKYDPKKAISDLSGKVILITGGESKSSIYAPVMAYSGFDQNIS
jgi:hypothetical protein